MLDHAHPQLTLGSSRGRKRKALADIGNQDPDKYNSHEYPDGPDNPAETSSLGEHRNNDVGDRKSLDNDENRGDDARNYRGDDKPPGGAGVLQQPGVERSHPT